MVINEKKQFIFVHVFRTGGSSIERSFGGNNVSNMHRALETVPNWRNYFSFGFVRNPWDRLVSSYMYAKSRKKLKKPFNEYVQQFMVGSLRTSKKHAQYNMVKNCSFIGRYEHLQEDYDTVCELIGMPRKTLPHLWKTKHTSYKTHFTDSQISDIAEVFSGDIEKFGFTFKGTATKNIGTIR